MAKIALAEATPSMICISMSMMTNLIHKLQHVFSLSLLKISTASSPEVACTTLIFFSIWKIIASSGIKLNGLSSTISQVCRHLHPFDSKPFPSLTLFDSCFCAFNSFLLGFLERSSYDAEYFLIAFINCYLLESLWSSFCWVAGYLRAFLGTSSCDEAGFLTAFTNPYLLDFLLISACDAAGFLQLFLFFLWGDLLPFLTSCFFSSSTTRTSCFFSSSTTLIAGFFSSTTLTSFFSTSTTEELWRISSDYLASRYLDE